MVGTEIAKDYCPSLAPLPASRVLHAREGSKKPKRLTVPRCVAGTKVIVLFGNYFPRHKSIKWKEHI